MKAISASIVIACATALLITGSYHPHQQSGLFLQLVAGVMGLIGVAGWLLTIAPDGTTKNSSRSSVGRRETLPSETEIEF